MKRVLCVVTNMAEDVEAREAKEEDMGEVDQSNCVYMVYGESMKASRMGKGKGKGKGYWSTPQSLLDVH